MSNSKIEWTDRSDWNPIRGCTRVSPGCGGPRYEGGCYAEAMAARFSLSAAELEAKWRADPNNAGKHGRFRVVDTCIGTYDPKVSRCFRTDRLPKNPDPRVIPWCDCCWQQEAAA